MPSPLQATHLPPCRIQWLLRVAGLFAVVAVLGLATATRSDAADVFGGTGAANGQFNEPRGIAVAPSGDVYVADARNDRVERFTGAGQFVSHVPGSFSFPMAVTFDGAGNLVVGDGGNYLIQVFGPSGGWLRQWPITYAPDQPGVSGLAVGKDGSVYQADFRLWRVRRYTGAGTEVAGWGSDGVAPGQFRSLLGIAVAPDGSVYTSDGMAKRVQRFTADGALLGVLPVSFGYPYGIAVGANGDVFVADLWANEVVRMTPAGVVRARYAVKSPGALALGAGPLVYVASGDTIVRIDSGVPTPRLVASTSTLATGEIVQLDASGSSVPLGWIARYEWDLDGDGTFELDTATTPSLRHAYRLGGAVAPAVRVTSQTGVTAVATTAVAVVAPAAAPPLIPGAGPGQTGASNDAGGALPANGSGGDPATGRLVPADKRMKLQVAFKRKVQMSGKLVDGTGAAIAGAQVDVYESIAGRDRRQVGSVMTNDKGEYEYLPITRSSRVIDLAYVARRGSAQAQSTHTLTIGVRAGIRAVLERSRIPARGRVTMTGRVSVDGLPTNGVVVEIRARERGRWLSTGVVRTDGKGRFRWTFRTRVARGTFPLQARVLKDDRMPALPAESRTLTLRVG